MYQGVDNHIMDKSKQGPGHLSHVLQLWQVGSTLSVEPKTKFLFSDRFRKMKQVTPEFLRRTGEKKLTAQTNTVFDPEYLDSMVNP